MAEIPPPDILPEHVQKSFIESGEDSLAHLIELCELSREEHVLDVGCGFGRMAVALASYLSSSGSYEGFDVEATKVDWCKENVSSRYPNFNFHIADVYSRVYNRSGDIKGTGYRFPYPDERFDVVFLFSVFTHMLPDDVEQYLSEIARVLRAGGRCLATFLLLNEESLSLIREDESRTNPGSNSQTARFGYDFGSHRLGDPERPEKVVAYDQQYVVQAFERNGFRVREPIRYGWWPGRDRGGRPGQDHVVADVLR